MEQQDYKKPCIFIFIFIFFSAFSYSQCFCSSIKFKLKLKDEVSLYSIKTVQAPDFALIETWRKFEKHEINGNNINFRFDTQGGIHCLCFLIKNNKRNTIMKVTVLNLTYDNPYYIDLTKFKKGNYLFDWKKINKCQKKFITNELVKCEGLQFYQLQLKSDKELKDNNNFYHNSIKPRNLKYFKQEKSD